MNWSNYWTATSWNKSRIPSSEGGIKLLRHKVWPYLAWYLISEFLLFVYPKCHVLSTAL